MDGKDIWNTIPDLGTKDEIVMIVDCSTSMNKILQEAQDGVNAFIKEQRKIEGGANITLVEFDTTAQLIYEGVDIQDAPEYKLVPRGWTALLDGIGMGIGAVPETDGKIIVVVVTDGDENSSKELSSDDVKALIESKKEAGWEFIFLAANQDAIKTGGNYGFDANASINFAASASGATQAYDAASLYTTSLRTKSKLGAVADLKKKVDDTPELG